MQHAQDRIFPLVRDRVVVKRAIALGIAGMPVRLPIWRARQDAVGHADELQDDTNRIGAGDTAGTGFAQSGCRLGVRELVVLTRRSHGSKPRGPGLLKNNREKLVSLITYPYSEHKRFEKWPG